MSDAVVTAPAVTTIAAPNTPAPEPEKAPETAPAEAAAPATEAPAAAPEAPKVEEPKAPEAKEFLALKREKAAIFKRAQEAKQLAQQAEQVKQALAPVQEAIDKFDDSPDAVLSLIAKTKGKTEQEIFDTLVAALAKRGDPPDPNDRVTKLERQLAEKDAAEKKAREEEQQRKIEEAEEHARRDMSAQVGVWLDQLDPESIETIRLWGSYYETVTPEGGIQILEGDEAREQTHKDLMDLGDMWHTTKWADLPKTVGNVAAALEELYLTIDERRFTNRLGKSRKLSKHWKPETPAPAESPPAPVAATPPTNAAPSASAGDTTNQNTSPRHISARRAVVPAGSKVVRRPSIDDEQEWIEKLGKNVRFTTG